MPSMISLKSFSSALAAFCMLVFVYSFMPDSFVKISQFLKYLTIISTIIILMMFYRILEQTETSVDNEIFTALNQLGEDGLKDNPATSFVKRVADTRSIDEKLYKIRIVVPKEIHV